MASIPQGASRSHSVARATGLSPATRVYAVADIHGRPDLLSAIHASIAEDLAEAKVARAVAVYLGDYIDRGNGSRQVIDMLCAPSPPGLDRVFLKGNHEAMMLSFLDGSTSCGTWIMNGGVATMRSYGIDLGGFGDMPRGRDSEDALRARLRAALPEAHARFFAGLKLWHVEGNCLFVHAGVRPGIPLERQDPHDLLWIRHEFLAARRPFDGLVVHGHTINPAPEIHEHRIGIDTGAYLSDALTCAVLQDDRVRFLRT
jgi:serine/threonine protein phosphatase 1